MKHNFLVLLKKIIREEIQTLFKKKKKKRLTQLEQRKGGFNSLIATLVVLFPTVWGKRTETQSIPLWSVNTRSLENCSDNPQQVERWDCGRALQTTVRKIFHSNLHKTSSCITTALSNLTRSYWSIDFAIVASASECEPSPDSSWKRFGESNIKYLNSNTVTLYHE